jgi:large subunit ribosomal protein L18
MKPETTTQRRARRVRHTLRQKAFVPGVGFTLRLSIFRSNTGMYAQIIDDNKGQTLVSASSIDKKLRKTIKSGRSIEAAKQIGTEIAARATKAGITNVYFDRGAFRYTGRVKALADAAREAGLKF